MSKPQESQPTRAFPVPQLRVPRTLRDAVEAHADRSYTNDIPDDRTYTTVESLFTNRR
jgi:hypothetical protein